MAGKAVLEDEIANLVMRSQNGVLVERVEGVMPGPFGDHADGLELRNARGDDRPDMGLPPVMVHDEIIIGDSRVGVGRAAGKIGFGSVLADMHA